MLTQLETETFVALKRAANKIANENTDWEERRYELVKSVLPAVVAKHTYLTDDQIVNQSIAIADEVIKALRKTI